jgi:hypothetical protein
MNRQEILNKVITFEDGKLLCDGLEITIEDAQEIIRLQSKAMEEEVFDYIQNKPELETEEITSLSDTVINTQMRIAQSKIDVKDLDEYQDIRADIKKADEICDKALKIFNFKNKKVEKTIKESNIKWKNNDLNSNSNEPDIDEMFETGLELLIKFMIMSEFKKQFSTSDIEIREENIEIHGNLVDDFQIYIITKDIEVYFQIDKNLNLFDGLKGEYIASGLRVNSMLMQTSLDSYTKSSHTLKTAYTFNNVITMEIRFLKNTIKQEINYSLSKSIAKSYDRFATANFFMINFGVLLDKKTKKKLNNIMKESIDTVEENKKIKEKNIQESIDENSSTETQIQENANTIKEFDSNNYLNYVLDKLLIVFNLKVEQIKIEQKKLKNDEIFEIQASGQKIIISILESGVIFVSSTNTLGTGKTDIQNYEAKGETIKDKLSNAVLASYIPILNRQIENIFNNVKGKSAKKISKDIEKTLKESVFDMLENKLDAESFKDKVYFVIDRIINIDSLNYEPIFEIIDKITNNFFFNQFKESFIEIQDKKQDVNILFKIFKSTLEKYKFSMDSGDSLIERFDIVKKYSNRLLSLIQIIKLIQDYKNIKFNIENIDISNTNIEQSIKKENEIRIIADNLSEDNLLGGTARKLLSLMDISLSSKDELYKFNLDEILSELITTNL